jgi:hypothetical protein
MLDYSVLNANRNEVKSIYYSPYFPGNPYLERGVAWNPAHPCMGSGSFYIEMNDGSTRVLSPILFKDENPSKNPNHFGGLEHWNLECWDYTQGDQPKRVKSIPGTTLHQLSRSDWVDINVITNGKSVKNHISWSDL